MLYSMLALGVGRWISFSFDIEEFKIELGEFRI